MAHVEDGIRLSKLKNSGLLVEFATDTSVLDLQVQTIQDRVKVTTPSVGNQEGGPSVDLIAVSAAVAQLRELLEASNADSLKAYANLAEILQGTVDRSRLQALSAAVQAFNFEGALLKLNEIANQYWANKN